MVETQCCDIGEAASFTTRFVNRLKNSEFDTTRSFSVPSLADVVVNCVAISTKNIAFAGFFFQGSQ